jgi:hypothetical protein
MFEMTSTSGCDGSWNWRSTWICSAEAAAERHLLGRRDVLVAEHEHVVVARWARCRRAKSSASSGRERSRTTSAGTEGRGRADLGAERFHVAVVAEVRLDVTAGDGAAARLYRRMGFVDAGAPVPMPGRTTFEQAMTLTLGA